MADTRIAWTDKVWNPVTGCSPVSAGCANCYAASFALRQMGPWKGRAFSEVRCHEDRLDAPLRWRKPRRIFVDSMGDLFHERISNEQIAAIFGVMAAAPLHVFQVLTKRADRMAAWFAWLNDHGGLGPYIRSIRVDGDRTVPDLFRATAQTETVRGRTVRASNDPWMCVFNAAACCGAGPLPNIWLGVSVEDQVTADARIPILLQTPAAVRFISAEPLLGPIDLKGEYLAARNGGRYPFPGLPGEHRTRLIDLIDWVIVGGESGPKARPCNVAWIRSIVQHCKAAGTACFVKQLGAHPYDQYTVNGGVFTDPMIGATRLKSRSGADPAEWPADLNVGECPR